jgi:glycosyltransferase involved in cell wall biosynthesis
LVGNIRAAKTARGLMKQQHGGFDVVHVHGALATILLKRTVMRARAVPTLIYTEHDATPWSCRYRSHWERVIRRRIYSLLNLRACRAAELVVTPYGPLAQELAVRTGLPTDHFAVVANGSRIVTQGHEWVSGPRARHGLRRYCLFVGALTARKAPDLLLRALSTVDLPCIFVGDGPMRKELERLAVKLGLSSRIVFTGALNPSDVYDYYAEAEFLALPSVSEAVPLVVLEALASGIPVIASRLDGICSVVRDGYNGLLVDPGNVGQLSTALALLGRDTRLRDRLASCASRDRGTAPTWPRLAGQLRVAYAHTCERA